MIDIYKWAKKHEVKPGVLAIKSSAMFDLKTSGKWLKSLKVNTLVEIGTCYGLSAAYFAQYANMVYTFDVADFQGRDELWKKLEVVDKIHFHLVKDRQHIKQLLKNIDFDFAFIDASHLVKDVISDWKLTKNCGRVLFHDVDEIRYPDNYKFLHRIGGKIIFNNTGYWKGIK